uniref:Uncharacterized protein n=1 Tax=Romanomermis culicivorax TaxID=13658 RepID=A0A915IY68_ROMCU
MREYIRDYISNPMRRTADFICIVHNMGREDVEYKGLMRMSTYGPTGAMIRDCTSAIGQRRPKRDMNSFCRDLFEDDE